MIDISTSSLLRDVAGLKGKVVLITGELGPSLMYVADDQELQ